MSAMKWVSSINSSPSFEKALRQTLGEMKETLGKDSADIAFLFASPHYRGEMIDLWPTLRRDIKIKNIIGCTAGGVIGDGKEVEQEPALSLTVGHLPNVQVKPFLIQQEELPDADKPPRAWRDLMGVPAELKPHFFIFSDPFSLDSMALLDGLDYAYPGSVKIGGLASGGQEARENLLLLNEKVLSKGSVGFAVSGDLQVEAIVAQGCRPIGKPMSITQSDQNILFSVDNQTPLEYIQDLYETLPERDQELLQSSLFLGILMDPYKVEPKQGDFLIRNIIGLDQKKGHLAIGAPLRNGQTVQFHLRDANTSRDDLKMMLSQAKSEKASGAVLFSCMGRGRRLYGTDNHDSDLLKSVVGNIPVGGFFCNGEIGPVDGKTYLHGYTSSIAVFSPAKPNEKEK